MNKETTIKITLSAPELAEVKERVAAVAASHYGEDTTVDLFTWRQPVHNKLIEYIETLLTQAYEMGGFSPKGD